MKLSLENRLQSIICILSEILILILFDLVSKPNKQCYIKHINTLTLRKLTTNLILHNLLLSYLKKLILPVYKPSNKIVVISTK